MRCAGPGSFAERPTTPMSASIQRIEAPLTGRLGAALTNDNPRRSATRMRRSLSAGRGLGTNQHHCEMVRTNLREKAKYRNKWREMLMARKVHCSPARGGRHGTEE